MRHIIGLLQPKLLVALVGSVFLFAPSYGNAPSADQQKADTSTEDATASSSGNNAPTSENDSLLADLFGKTSVDPKFTLPDVGPSQQTQDAAGLREPAQEPARSIYRYLVASSEIGFKSDKTRLGIAFATTEKGDATAINTLIADLDGKFAQLQALTPPSELQEIHEASLRVVQQYIGHLKESRDAGPGNVLNTWKSGERQAMGDEAARVVKEIRDIVNKYNIILPSGVLP